MGWADAVHAPDGEGGDTGVFAVYWRESEGQQTEGLMVQAVTYGGQPLGRQLGGAGHPGSAVGSAHGVYCLMARKLHVVVLGPTVTNLLSGSMR